MIEQQIKIIKAAAAALERVRQKAQGRDKKERLF